MLDGAVETLHASGVTDDRIDVAWVPGSWEIPIVAQRLASGRKYAAIITLGAVIRGETTHDEHINRGVSLALVEIALSNDLPVLFGVLTCNSMEQAIQRAGGNVGNKGSECAEAALKMVGLLEEHELTVNPGMATRSRSPRSCAAGALSGGPESQGLTGSTCAAGVHRDCRTKSCANLPRRSSWECSATGQNSTSYSRRRPTTGVSGEWPRPIGMCCVSGPSNSVIPTRHDRVVLNEAVELAKRFGSKQSSQFVNGILDKLVDRKETEGEK